MASSFPSDYKLRAESLFLVLKHENLEGASLEEVMELVGSAKVTASSSSHKGTGKKWEQYAVLLEALKRLSMWLQKRKKADPDAVLQRDAAHALTEDYIATNEPTDEFIKAFELVNTVQSNNDLQELLLELRTIPFPICGEFKAVRSGSFNLKKIVDQRAKLAFLNFKIDDRPAKEIDTLNAGMSYDLEIDLRLNNWPKGADTLVLTPISLEPKTAFELPTFEIARSEMKAEVDGAFKFSRKGRLIIRNPQSLGSRPYEFSYNADFEPYDRYGSFDVIGHRSLRLEGVDLSHSHLSGFANIDRKILELRNEVRSIPRMNENVVADAIKLLAAVGGISQQALTDASFSTDLNEAEFQNDLIIRLRANPTIGERLEVHPSSGGGIADLSFERLRLELKVDLKGGDFEKRLKKYAAQAHQYAVASGKEIALLGVLRPAEKKSVSTRAEDNMSILRLDDGSIAIVVQILCGLPLPSSLSR